MIFQDYFEDLIKKATPNEDGQFPEPNNKIQESATITNIPVLTAKVYAYYPYVKEDFKNIIRIHYKLIDPDKQIDPFEANIISEEQLADMFLDINRSYNIYKDYVIGDIIMCKNAKEYINKTVNYDTPEKIPEALSSLSHDIKNIKIKLTRLIGDIFNEIKKYIEGTPEFYVKDQAVHAIYLYVKSLINLRIYNENNQKLLTSQLKSMWKFTNGCFIQQINKVFELIDILLNIEKSYNFKTYLKYYRDEHFLTNGNPYFIEIYFKIINFRERVLNFNDTPDINHDINELNRMSKDLQNLAVNAIGALGLTIENFIIGLEDVEGYNILTNKTKLPQKDSDEFKRARNQIEKYVEYIWKIARAVDIHIGLTKEEKKMDLNSYSIELAKKLSITPSYTSKASQMAFNMLLAVSAAGTYILQKIFSMI
ncbi:hypothetical protein NEIRO03_2477 [Nematocida sp. AWRm78]|nr:hypothetical protein NEIRO03_2477 [Nematocida sp. AWRm78]